MHLLFILLISTPRQKINFNTFNKNNYYRWAWFNLTRAYITPYELYVYLTSLTGTRPETELESWDWKLKKNGNWDVDWLRAREWSFDCSTFVNKIVVYPFFLLSLQFHHDFPLLSLRGAGQEVGRSCVMLEFKNKKIMVSSGSQLTTFV